MFKSILVFALCLIAFTLALPAPPKDLKDLKEPKDLKTESSYGIAYAGYPYLGYTYGAYPYYGLSYAYPRYYYGYPGYFI